MGTPHVKSKYFFNRKDAPNADKTLERKKYQIPADAFSSYLDGWNPKLISYFEQKQVKPNKTKLSFPALFLGVAYFGYARIGAWGILLIACMSIIDYVMEATFGYGIHSFLYALISAYTFNDLVIYRAERIYKKLKAKSLSDEQIIKAISGEGRPSLIEGAACALVFVAFVALELFLLDLI